MGLMKGQKINLLWTDAAFIVNRCSKILSLFDTSPFRIDNCAAHNI
jgi:hypothetical protein